MSWRRAGVVAFVVLTGLGNAPHPSSLCAGKVAGDRCQPYGSFSGCSRDDGVCKLQPDCTDYPETLLNECLVCD